MEFVNIFSAFSENRLHKFGEICWGALSRFVKYILRIQQNHLTQIQNIKSLFEKSDSKNQNAFLVFRLCI